MKVGVTLVCRSAKAGETHGIFLSVDLETGVFHRLKETSSVVDPQNPRGGGRGFRGVVHDSLRERTYLADYGTIRVLDRDFNEVDRLAHPSLAHIHALDLVDNKLWAVSTANDLIFCFDVNLMCLLGAYELSASEDGTKTAAWVPSPQRSVQRPGRSRFHLNAVLQHGRELLVSGLRTFSVCRISPEGSVRSIACPGGTHDIALTQQGQIVLLGTEQKAVLVRREEEFWQPFRLPESGIQVAPSRVSPLVARPWYLRGAKALSNGRVAVGFSPASVITLEPVHGTFGSPIQITSDVRWMVAGICSFD